MFASVSWLCLWNLHSWLIWPGVQLDLPHTVRYFVIWHKRHWISMWTKLYVFKWIFNSLEARWLLFQFVPFYFVWLFKYRKKPRLWRKRSLRIFQTAYLRKVRPDPSCQPSGQPGSQEKLTGQRASLAHRESATWRGGKIEFRSCWGLWDEGTVSAKKTRIFQKLFVF